VQVGHRRPGILDERGKCRRARRAAVLVRSGPLSPPFRSQDRTRPHFIDFHGGALKLVADRERGVLIGATLVTPRAGEIVGELVLAIKLGIPVKTLADVIHPYPAFNRVLGQGLDELAAKMAPQSAMRA
jgi:hypothetical protein